MWGTYEVIDDFLTDEHMALVENLEFDTGPLDWDMYNHDVSETAIISKFMRKDQDFKSVRSYNPGFQPLSDDIVYSMHHRYIPFLMKAFHRIAPEKIDQHTHTSFNVVNTGKDYVFPIHSDRPDKLLTTVIYISDQNEGTWLYDTESGENARQVDWVKNRAFIFSRNEDAWHSYNSNGADTRRTMVISLRSDM